MRPRLPWSCGRRCPRLLEQGQLDQVRAAQPGIDRAAGADSLPPVSSVTSEQKASARRMPTDATRTSGSTRSARRRPAIPLPSMHVGPRQVPPAGRRVGEAIASSGPRSPAPAGITTAIHRPRSAILVGGVVEEAEQDIGTGLSRPRETCSPRAGAMTFDAMTATSWTGRRRPARLIYLGLPGAVALLVLAAAIAAFTASRPAAAARRGDDWVTSWSASPQHAMPGTLAAAGFDDQTVREIIFPSVGGDQIRLELTNAFGLSPLQVGHVTVAVAGLGAEVVPGTIHPVTFGGSASVRIPAGAQVLSDPVGMQVSAAAGSGGEHVPAGPDRRGHARTRTPSRSTGCRRPVTTPARRGRARSRSRPRRGTTSAASSCDRPERPGPWSRSATRSPTACIRRVGGNARWPNDLARRLDAPGWSRRSRWPTRGSAATGC